MTLRAIVRINVPDDVEVDIDLRMPYATVKELLAACERVDAWPMGDFRQVLRGALNKANAAYTEVLKIGGD